MNILSPLSSNQKSSIINVIRITHRNSQGVIQFPSTDRVQSINKANANNKSISIVDLPI